MASILRIKLRWTGFSGAPGYSIFHFRDFETGEGGGVDATQAQSAADRVRAFALALVDLLPAGARLQVEPDVEVLEETNGQMQDILQVTPGATVAGKSTNTGSYSGATGAVVNWRTASVRNGRRIRGRTFLVPLYYTAYDSDGTINTTALTAIRTAADALVAGGNSPDLGVWARPSASGASDGNWVVASSATVPDLAAVLRSRRD